MKPPDAPISLAAERMARQAATWQTFVTFPRLTIPPISNGVIASVALLMVAAVVFYTLWTPALITSKRKSSERRAGDYDPAKPDTTAAPRDLTTLGAAGPMPDGSHPIYRHPQAADISREMNDFSPESIKHELFMLNTRLDAMQAGK